MAPILLQRLKEHSDDDPRERNLELMRHLGSKGKEAVPFLQELILAEENYRHPRRGMRYRYQIWLRATQALVAIDPAAAKDLFRGRTKELFGRAVRRGDIRGGWDRINLDQLQLAVALEEVGLPKLVAFATGKRNYRTGSPNKEAIWWLGKLFEGKQGQEGYDEALAAVHQAMEDATEDEKVGDLLTGYGLQAMRRLTGVDPRAE